MNPNLKFFVFNCQIFPTFCGFKSFSKYLPQLFIFKLKQQMQFIFCHWVLNIIREKKHIAGLSILILFLQPKRPVDSISIVPAAISHHAIGHQVSYRSVLRSQQVVVQQQNIQKSKNKVCVLRIISYIQTVSCFPAISAVLMLL